jgi:hypothetical protein
VKEVGTGAVFVNQYCLKLNVLLNLVPSLAGDSAGITKFPETPYESLKLRATSVSCDHSCANVPQLNTHNIKLLAVVTQRLVTESRARF